MVLQLGKTPLFQACYGAGLPKTASSKLTLLSKTSFAHESECTDIIIDGGATASMVMGWSRYIDTCHALGIQANILPLKDGYCRCHVFGTKENSSKPEDIIGRCIIPISVINGYWWSLLVLVVEKKVPFIMGKNSLVDNDGIEAHGRG